VRAASGYRPLFGARDGPELVAWIEKRRPIRHQLFLVHGEVPALEGLRDRIAGLFRPGQVVLPVIDQSFELGRGTGTGAGAPRRLAAHQVGHNDWHNDVSRQMLDIGDAVTAASDDKARGVLVRRLRRALQETG
jgi:metallo-beta-lactamase family protein